MYVVTAAGNGMAARYGYTSTSPVYETLYTGEEVDVLTKTYAGSPIVYVPDFSDYFDYGSSTNIWYPLNNTTTGAVYMTRESGTCSVSSA